MPCGQVRSFRVSGKRPGDGQYSAGMAAYPNPWDPWVKCSLDEGWGPHQEQLETLQQKPSRGVEAELGSSLAELMGPCQGLSGDGVAKSRTRLSDFTFTSHFHALEKEMTTHSSVLA